MTSQELGETEGNGISFDDIPVSSVIYIGRGSFRMEAVALERTPTPEADGVVQAVTGIVTAPLHATEPAREGLRPRLRSLFGSQVEVPLLAAPTGPVGLHAPAVTLSRPMLATVCGLVLVCGIVVGTAARHLLAAPAPLAVVATPPVFATTPVVAAPAAPVPVTASTPTVATAPPLPPPVVSVPAPVTIRAHARTATKPATDAPARKAPTEPPVAAEPPSAPSTPKVAPKPAPKPWVDPWAS